MEVIIKLNVSADKLASIISALDDTPAVFCTPSTAPAVINPPAPPAPVVAPATSNHVHMLSNDAPIPHSQTLPTVPAAVVPAAPTPEPAGASVTIAAPIAAKTLEDIRQLVMQITPALRISIVQGVLANFGVNKLSDIPPDKYNEAFEAFSNQPGK